MRQNRDMPYARSIRFSIAIAAAALMAACVTTPRTETLTATAPGADCVVLIHGVNRSWRAMRPMAQALQASGFNTVNVDYPSRSGTVDKIAPMAVGNGLAACRAMGAETIHFVTHSIGGILVRFEQRRSPIPELGRVVMLAPPNQGSEVVDKTRFLPGASLVGGRALLQLGTRDDDVPAQLGAVDFEVGVIAGTGTINPWMSAMLPDQDDGKVSVVRTRVDGMTDFLIVGDNHHYIVEDETVIRNTIRFLSTGEFRAEDKGGRFEALY